MSTSHVLHLMCDSAAKLTGPRRVHIEGQVLYPPGKSCLKNVDWRGTTVAVNRVHRIIPVRESASTPINAGYIIANEKAARLGVHSPKNEIGMCATLCSHGPIGDDIGHGTHDGPYNPRMRFGVSSHFRPRVVHEPAATLPSGLPASYLPRCLSKNSAISPKATAVSGRRSSNRYCACDWPS